MKDPISLEAMLAATIAGASVVIAGACYALFFAIGRLQERQVYSAIALLSYLLLAGAVGVLVVSLRLEGLWGWLALVMLVGYYAAPRLIWKLCVGTHGSPGGSAGGGVRND